MKVGLFAMIFFVFAFGRLEIVYAQQSLPTEKPCGRSAKEILSEIETSYHLFPASDKVLVAGQVFVPQLLAIKKQLSLTQVLAMVGGLSRTARPSLYLLRQTITGETQIITEVDLRSLRTGRTEDPALENGDVVFVPRRCSGGKTGPLTDAPIEPLLFIDAPIHFPNVPFAQKRPKV